jgi:hypothetical protein
LRRDRAEFNKTVEQVAKEIDRHGFDSYRR